MKTCSLAFALVLTLAILPTANAQQPVVLKNGTTGLAALALVPEGILFAYVATGREGKDNDEKNWSEVRLMTVDSGKYQVLDRKATPVSLPGIGANHSIVGFAADGKSLKVSSLSAGGISSEFVLKIPAAKEKVETPKGEGPPAKGKISAARLKGMKDAVADIEKGFLKRKEFALPSPDWFPAYVAALKKECGIDWVTVNDDQVLMDPNNPRAELDGYNSIMRVEIEHRFGTGILEKLRQQAEKAKASSP